MDEAINFLNVEIGIFLRYLRCFSQIENVQINKKTMELMQEAKSNMKDLAQRAQVIENSARNDVDFLFDLNEHQYELQRHIMCRACYEQFPLSKDDFTAHLNAKHHATSFSGSNSFSSDFFTENESTISHPNGHSTATSPDHAHHLSSDQSSADDSGYSHQNQSNAVAVVTQPKYSDILKTAAPEPTGPPQKAPTNGVAVKLPSIAMTLGDLIRTNQCYDAISKKTTELLAPDFHRCKNELIILDLMTKCIKTFDSTLSVHPFGSAIYDLCGAKSNYNILVDTRKSKKSSAMLLRSFQQYFATSSAVGDFDMPNKINETRVQKSQLLFIHKVSRIECSLRFDNDVSVLKAAKIISDVITLKPISRHLIAYIKCWQYVVSTLSRDSTTFQFNTYIIAVLVIFFLQMDYGLPAAGDILVTSESKTTNDKSTPTNTKGLNDMLADFFHFYGGRFEINNHLISTSIGRWQQSNLYQIQEQKLSGHQMNFTPNQKRLRDGITSNPLNWQKCTMFVQDLVEAGVNITAEVSKEEAYNFQEMCQMFSTGRKTSPVKRRSPVINAQAVRKAFSHNSLNDIKSNANHVVHTIKNDKSKASVTAATVPESATKKVVTPKKAVSVILENAIKDGSIFKMITTELDKITRSDERVRHEARILGILKQHFKIFDRAVALIPFGSTVFGFASCNSNYNIFVDTRKSKFSRSSSVLEAFEKYLEGANIHVHFDGIAEIPASRTLKQQLRLIHKESGIHVLLLVDDIAVTEVPKIIRNFITIRPICQNLITHVLAWQSAINGILEQNESYAFQFNAYMISILVIFFMQVNYEIPVISEIAATRSNSDAMKKINASFKKDLGNIDKLLADFFWFYGQRYQIWNHVISLHIGRWQERRIQDKQKHFLPNQKRLRDGINKNPENWKNCYMYIEDLLRSGVNIAAEITAKDAHGFQEICQIFAKKHICQKICHEGDED